MISPDEPAYRPSSYQSSSDKRRAIGVALAVVAHLLVLLVMLRISPELLPPILKNDDLTTFTVLPEQKPTENPKPRAVEKLKRASGGAPKPKPDKPDTPVTTKPEPVPPPAPILIGGKEMFDAADISKLASGKSDGASGTGKGKDSGSVYGPGEGPGGERLYNAEWFREPTRAEMAYYMPPSVPDGAWALIACQTVERYHVENCRSLGESPVGSGLSRTLRLAAWQFLVRPPRIGGKPQIGAWVRIRFDFTTGKVG